MKWIFLILVALSCSHKDNRAKSGMHAEAYSYMDEFIKAHETAPYPKYPRIRDSEIDFVDMAEYLNDSHTNVIGTCYYFVGKIKIDISYWNSATKLERKALIFHELGHCSLLRDHTCTSHDPNRASFMQSQAPPHSFLVMAWESMMEELFYIPKRLVDCDKYWNKLKKLNNLGKSFTCTVDDINGTIK